MDRFDSFVAELYQSIEYCSTEAFRKSVLRQLRALINVDGALCGSGNYTSRVFHSVVTLGVDPGYPAALERTQDANPLVPALMSNAGRAFDLRSVIDDATLYASPIYRQCFAPYGIERILSYVGQGPRSNLYTLISLYRFERDRCFSEEDRQLFERAAYHVIAATNHAYFVHVATLDAQPVPETIAAVCDGHGLIYRSQSGFGELLADAAVAPSSRDHLPFELPPAGDRLIFGALCVESEPVGDLFCVRIWRRRPIDALKARDRAIVAGVCRGMTFKDIGRELDLAPSTVSNRLYRVYRQLGVVSRSSLVRLVHGSF